MTLDHVAIVEIVNIKGYMFQKTLFCKLNMI
jgi:hypothetical protein